MMMSSRNGGGLGSSSSHRRGGANSDLHLFSNTLRSLSSDVSVKVGRVSAKVSSRSSSGIQDLLSSTEEEEEGKHDYDWLLTPPGTPSSESQSHPSLSPPRRSMNISTSTTKASRFSVSQSENNHNQSRPARSSSVTRPSISSSHSQTQYNPNSSNRSSSSILNTSSASVSSYIRPSSPITRSQSTASRPSTPSSRTTPLRPSTPSKPSSTADKSRPSPQSSRPSTPSSRPQIPANLHSPSAPPTRSLSRPSTPTPTRRSSMPSPSLTTASSASAGCASLNGHNSAPVSRPKSPSPRPRPAPQPVIPPNFPLDTPPNLRTILPDRPVSAGRSRPGAATLKTNSETHPSSVNNNISRRHSSPIVNKGRLTEPAAGKSSGYANSNGHHVDVPEPRKLPHAPEVGARRSVKSSTTTTDNTGFGRTISKKSLDMAIKHMDIRNGSGNLRALSNTTVSSEYSNFLHPEEPVSSSFKYSSIC